MPVSRPPEHLDLAGLRARLGAADPDGRLVPLGIDTIVLGHGVAERVAEHVATRLTAAGRPADRHARVVLLADDVVIRRGGLALKPFIEDVLAARFTTVPVVLRDGHATLHADEPVLATAAEAVAGADCVVTVGSGTITDIGKVATDRAGGLPLVVVQTAASVDGFTDNVSVVLRDGVKRTIPSRWPDVILTDVDVVAGAPSELNLAGFGEMMSTFCAPADWRLAAATGVDDGFHPAVTDLLGSLSGDLTDWSAELPEGGTTAAWELSRTLARRGIATGVAGTTACLSGVEHLISHLLDMHHAAHGAPTGLHGAQVGVASLVATALWEDALARDDLDPSRLALPEPDTVRNEVDAAFGALDADGALARECWQDVEAKLGAIGRNWAQVTAAVADWPRLKDAFAPLVWSRKRVADSLHAAGVPASFAALDPSVGDDLARWALASCHRMRNRFTLVDLLDLLGEWTPETIDRALAAAGVASRQPSPDPPAPELGTVDPEPGAAGPQNAEGEQPR